MVVMLEIARMALNDGRMSGRIADELDLSDEYVQELRDTLEKELNLTDIE